MCGERGAWLPGSGGGSLDRQPAHSHAVKPSSWNPHHETLIVHRHQKVLRKEHSPKTTVKNASSNVVSIIKLCGLQTITCMHTHCHTGSTWHTARDPLQCMAAQLKGQGGTNAHRTKWKGGPLTLLTPHLPDVSVCPARDDVLGGESHTECWPQRRLRDAAELGESLQKQEQHAALCKRPCSNNR